MGWAVEGCEREIGHCERRAQDRRSVCRLWCAANATWSSSPCGRSPLPLRCTPAGSSAFRPSLCARAAYITSELQKAVSVGRALFGNDPAIFLSSAPLVHETGQKSPVGESEPHPRSRSGFSVITFFAGTLFWRKPGVRISSAWASDPHLGLVARCGARAQIHFRGLCHWAGELTARQAAEPPS